MFGGAVAAYIWIISATGDLKTQTPALLDVTYLTMSVVAYIGIVRYSWQSPVTRHLMLCADVFALSAAFVAAGPMAAPTLFLYIWLTIGYGFRYGVYYLRLAGATSLIGLIVALLWTNFWRTQAFVSAGIIMLALVIPPYLELLLRRTIKANQEAEDANHGKMLMLAGLGHNLRVPLNAISDASKIVTKGVLDLPQRAALTSISTATRSLLSDLDDFLDVSRIDAGRMPHETTEFGLREVLEEVTRIAGVKANAKGLTLGWYVSAGVPLHICSERRYLLRTLTNVVENAVKFTSVGSVLITVRVGQPDVGTLTLRFEILDTGIGVRQDARKKIFESFMQATPEIYQTYGGSGLGLSVAKRLMELLGGKIGVDSLEGVGSTFWLETPVSIPNSSEWTNLALTGCAIMILSPRTDSLLALAVRIEKLGARVFLSSQVDHWSITLGEALEEVERIVVIVDGRDTDASEVAYALRKSGLLDRVPLVLLDTSFRLPILSVRRQFLTSIHPEASDKELISALYLAGVEGSKNVVTQNDNNDVGSARPPEARGSAVRVLVVDSSRTTIMILSRILELAECTVTVVENGNDALDLVERAVFDLIVIDVDKPRVDGIETVKLFRFQQVGRRYTPVYGLTSRKTPSALPGWEDAGMDGLLTLPIDLGQLSDIIKQISPSTVNGSLPHNAQESVQSISSHPKFRKGFGPPFKDEEFQYLSRIGGEAFVGEITQMFVTDATRVSTKLLVALRAHDLESFHLLSSSLLDYAAVIGATRLADLSKIGVEMDQANLGVQGRSYLERLNREIDRVVQALASRSSENSKV